MTTATTAGAGPLTEPRPDARRTRSRRARRALVAVPIVVAIAIVLGMLAPPPSEGVYWGSEIGSQFGQQPPWNWRALISFQDTNAGAKPISVLAWGSPFYSGAWCNGYCAFQSQLFKKVRLHGVIPFLSWASINAGAPGDPTYTDAQIAAGSEDAYIIRWARAAKAWGHPFFLRLDWEMNLGSFPWGQGNQGNTPRAYVDMWRHVHQIFDMVGARNVTWVWCPNVVPAGSGTSLASLYPGAQYVDWTCLDGYNGGDPWTSFAALFRPSYIDITRTIAPSKPMIIGEVGSTESGGSKAQWIAGMFKALHTSFPDIHGLLWYDAFTPGPGGHSDWPIESSPASEAAFTAGIGGARYQTDSYRDLNQSPIPPP